MEQIKNSPFRLDSFTVIESHIKRQPEKLKAVKVDIRPKGVLNRKIKNFSLFLDVSLNDSHSFDINISCIGSFTFQKEIKEEDLSNYFIVSAPAIIFPYIRSYVSALTALSGLEAINLPVMNLTGLKQELKNNIIDLTERINKLQETSKTLRTKNL